MSDEAKTVDKFIGRYDVLVAISTRVARTTGSVRHVDEAEKQLRTFVADELEAARIEGAEAQRMAMRKAWDDCEGSEVMAWCAAFNDTYPRAVVEKIDAK